MTLDNLPVEIRNLYEVYEWRHASAILKDDFSAEWNDIIVRCPRFLWTRNWDKQTPYVDKEASGWQRRSGRWERSWA